MISQFEVVDLSGWLDGGKKIAVVDQVRADCEELGFFLIKNHRFDEALIVRMYQLSRGFFDLPETTKQGYPADGPVLGGFEFLGFERESLSATLGCSTPPDRKEAMDFGPGFGGVEWPSQPAGLEATWYEYFHAMEQLCRELRAILARAADLSEDFFEDKFKQHLSSIRVINYPELDTPARPGQLRAGAHTDYGFLTVLLSEDRPGGLEVQTPLGDWVQPPMVPGTFVVNLGDCLMRWTNDLWSSTPHRVVNPPADAATDTRRQSIAFFHNPARDAVIDVLPTFLTQGQTPRYEPTTYGEYAMLRQGQASGNQSLAKKDRGRTKATC